MIVDMHTVQRIRSKQRTAILRDAPLKGDRQPVQTRREAKAEDPAIDRERQVRHPDRPAVIDTHAWVDITNQEQLKVAELAGEDLKRLGYPNPREFRRDWPNDRLVWFVTFELVQQEVAPVRLVARNSGYTSNPALAIDQEAGEAVDRDTQQRFTDEARTHDHMRHQRRREGYERHTTEERLRLAKAEAAARKVDISHHERVIADRVERIERQLGKDKAA